MFGMTGLEIDNFYKYDNHEYDIKKNKYILEMYEKSSKYITLNNLDNLMNDIVSFFETKYPNVLFYCTTKKNSEEFKNAIKISNLMDINQLYFRIYHDCILFLDCPYSDSFTVKKMYDCYPELKSYSVNVDEDGTIDRVDLENLKDNNFIVDIDEITYVSDLYGKFESVTDKIDYNELKNLIYKHKYDIMLREKFLNLVSLKMIYSKETLPIYGYERVKSFVKMFNKKYGLGLTIDRINQIMNIDYKNCNEIEKNLTKRKN